METPLELVMFVVVRLYLMHPRSTWAKFVASAVPSLVAKSMRSIWLIWEEVANSLASARASETV